MWVLSVNLKLPVELYCAIIQSSQGKINFDDKVSKIISNLEEVKARGGKIIVIADTRVESYLPEGIWKSFFIPSFKSIFSPFLFSIPVQLIAYHTAVQKGTVVYQPRNLAKSVTVE